ncbi:MAG: DUF2520 domain-containing protein [Nannocystaceae bacterium]|nr:DUF2520 domain-containing protein [Nannocystaceae bacterium]
MNREPVVGVLGGAFDPPHLGHALLPAYLRARGWVDAIVVAPAANHPFGKAMAPFEQRLAWCRAAMADYGPWLTVSAIERTLAEREPGPSYTLRLLEAIAAQQPGARVRLVVGSDITRSGDTAKWHRWDEIERRFAPLVVPRAGWSEPQACTLPEVSSRAIRAWLQDGGPQALAQVADAVPASVFAMLQPAGAPVWIVGRGHVSTHAAEFVARRGHRVEVLGGHAVADGGPLPQQPPAAVWIAVRDGGITPVAQGLVGRIPPQTVVLHAAGSRRSEDVLAPLRAAGHAVGSLHPAASMRGGAVRASILEQAVFGIEGDAAAEAWARALVAPAPVVALGGLDARARTAYHAACALVANHLAVLTLQAESVWGSLGADATLRTALVGSLLRSAVENLLALGVPAGISGPATRGDRAGIAAHRDALPPGAAAVYDWLGTRLLDMLARTSP